MKKYMLKIVFGLAFTTLLVLTIIIFAKVINPKKVLSADKGDLEQLAYTDMLNYYDRPNSTARTVILEAQDQAVSTSKDEFYNYLKELYPQSEITVYNKTFRLKMNYHKRLGGNFSASRNTGTDWFDGACFTRKDGDLLMCTGLVFINDSLPARSAKQILFREYSTDQTSYILLGSFVGVFAIAVGIVFVFLMRRSE